MEKERNYGLILALISLVFNVFSSILLLIIWKPDKFKEGWSKVRSTFKKEKDA